MKKQSLLLAVTTLSLLNVRCSDWGKEPANGFDNLNTQARTEQEQIRWEKNNPRPVPQPEKVFIPEEKEVVKEVTRVSPSDVVIAADSQMDFIEGQSVTFKVRVSSTLPGLKLDLKQEGLPQGASLLPSKSEKDLYTLTWTPGYGTITSTKGYEVINVKLSAEPLNSSEPKVLARVKGLVFEKTVQLNVRKSQEAPKDVVVQGLNSEISEGELVTFKVTATVPGFEGNTTQKPTLSVYYDGAAVTNGNKFQELDGSRHVVIDLSQKDAKYLGNSKWEFSRKFDTQYISVQPQLGLDGKVLAGADGTRVRVSFKVTNGNNISAAEVTKQIKIRYKKSSEAAPAETAPAQPATQEGK